MSFSYKTLNSTDLTLTSYTANKFWEVQNSTLKENGVTIYVGENIPINHNSPYDPIDDIETSNEESQRLVFNSVRHLYYKNYTSGSLTGEFFNSSSYYNYEQNTLASGSMVSTFRNMNPTSGSNPLYAYDLDLYEQALYDVNRGGKVVVISIDQEIFGSGLSPHTVFISGSGYYLRDDGEGNLYNYRNENNYARYNSAIYDKDIYLELLNSDQPQLEYAGNVFYSHGLIVITNEDYICVFGAPPTAVNDYFSYFNMNQSQSFDILSNDVSNCGHVVFNSFTASQVNGYTFPDYTYSNGLIYIANNQSSVIPGKYQIGYTVKNETGIQSNTGSINLEITSLPLEIDNIISSSVGYGTSSILPVTFSVNYGVPFYSYSLDGGNTYFNTNHLFEFTLSGSVTASANNIIYVKDYLGNLASASFSSWYNAIGYTAELKSPCSSTSTDGRITVSGSTGVSASLNGGSYFRLPTQFSSLSTGSYSLNVKDINNNVTSSNLTLNQATPVTLLSSITHVKCFGGKTGQIALTLYNTSNNYSINWTKSGVPVIGSGSLTLINVPTGSYTASIVDNTLDGCQNLTTYFTITGSSLMSFSVSASYINSCSSAIVFNATGGLPPYTYYAKNNSTLQIYSSTSSSVELTGFGLSSGNFSTYIIDSNNCLSTNGNLDIYGRSYIYSGSSCELI